MSKLAWVWVALFCLTGCIRLPDLGAVNEVAEMVDQTMTCQRIAMDCVEFLEEVEFTDPDGGMLDGGFSFDDFVDVYECAERWEQADCSDAVEDLLEAAEDLMGAM